jgi:glycosyltransferase involved in cell wall biosynthesis
MVEVGDAAGLAQSLIHVLEDDAKMVAIGSAARNTALAKFSIENCVMKTEALYLDMIRQG